MDSASLMLTSEPAIHLKDGEDFLCNVSTSQDELDALHALINWLDGYAAGSGKGIPGHYELTVLFRAFRANHIAKHGRVSGGS